MENQEKSSIDVLQLKRAFESLAGKAITPLVFIFIYSIVQLIRLGNKSDYLLLLIGCILSVMAIVGFGYTIVNKKRSFIHMLLSLSGFIPYLFGAYLVFISGFWSLKELTNGFSIIVILKAIIFVFFGYRLVSEFYQITEIGKL